MQIRCPHCHVPFDSVEQASWADMLCPACGSSFSLSGTDATYTYRPGVQVLGHFELLQQVGRPFRQRVEGSRYAVAAHRGSQDSAAEGS